MLYRFLFSALFLMIMILELPAQEAPGGLDQLLLINEAAISGRFLQRAPDGSITFQPTGEAVSVYSPGEIRGLLIGSSGSDATDWDRVILMNGSTFTGRIKGSSEAGELVLELEGRSTIKFLMEEVQRIERAGIPAGSLQTRRDQNPRAYQFREKGWFNASYFVGLSGRASPGFQLGLGVHTTTGYQWNRWVGVGLGLGVDAYSFESNEIIVPVSLEVRGYLTRRHTAPYYVLNTGYGFALKNEQQGYIGADGGFLIHPALGLRFGASPDVNVLFDLGYRFQRASYDRVFEFSGIREQRTVNYKRLTMRLGLLF